MKTADCGGSQWPRLQVSMWAVRATGDLLIFVSPMVSCCGQGNLSWHLAQLTGVLLIVVLLANVCGVTVELGARAQAVVAQLQIWGPEHGHLSSHAWSRGLELRRLQSWNLKCKHLTVVLGFESICEPVVALVWGSAAANLSC